MIVLVCGSRDWPDDQRIMDRLADLKREHGTFTVLHGGAFGADSAAGAAARALDLPVTVMPADWKAHGRGAGYRRNMAMLDQQPDLVVAFTTGSRGTQHTIDEAPRRGIPLEIHRSPRD